jgi:hypothetical protein
MLVLRRLATALPSVADVINVTFLLTRTLPGDPTVYFAGSAVTQQAIAEIRRLMGFDRSLPVQFFDYLRHLAHGDLGTALTTGQPVLRELATRLPASAELTLSALLLSVGIAVPLGIVAALRPGSLVDHRERPRMARLYRPRAPLHPGTVVGDSATGHPPHPDRSRRGAAEPDRSRSANLPALWPLFACHRSVPHLCTRTETGRTRTACGVPSRGRRNRRGEPTAGAGRGHFVRQEVTRTNAPPPASKCGA